MSTAFSAPDSVGSGRPVQSTAAAQVTAARTPPKAPIPDDPAAIQRAIEERQRRLAATVDELRFRLQPKELARRGKESARKKAQDAVTAEDGSLRTERIGAVVAALVALLVLVAWRHRRTSRSSSSD